MTFEDWWPSRMMMFKPDEYERAKEAYQAGQADARELVEKMREALEIIEICVWADEFPNADAKLDSIDKVVGESIAEADKFLGKGGV